MAHAGQAAGKHLVCVGGYSDHVSDVATKLRSISDKLRVC